MPPTWLTVIAWISLALAFATAGLIIYDIFGRGYRQQMAVMAAVWPVTALYLGPLAWWGYRRWGRLNSPRYQQQTGREPDYREPVSVAIGVSHCGAGCTLGDIIGAWIVFAAAFALLGLALPAEYIADFTLAFALGIAFQYFAIAPMRGLGVRDGLVAALKADTLSLTAFEIGLFGWMAIMQLVLFTAPHLTPDHAAYWFLMQIGMILGFLTAYPVNVWLIRRGIKEAM
ncbi:MAG: DUF4396 domain-containing protein [Solirubrobacteraceae bacterium]